jgi:uncharacterized protein YndB with AHSA1/START domain
MSGSELTFIKHGGQTTLTTRDMPYNTTTRERQTFEGAFASLRQGLKGTLDQLEAYAGVLA